jgi:hypothetical protein
MLLAKRVHYRFQRTPAGTLKRSTPRGQNCQIVRVVSHFQASRLQPPSSSFSSYLDFEIQTLLTIFLALLLPWQHHKCSKQHPMITSS